MCSSVKIMYLDESGDHRLKKINPVYPIFVLGGVVVERAYMREVIEPRVRAFKQRFWGNEDVILHTVDMRNNAGDFAFLTDPVQRATFYAELNTMLQELEYKVIACVFRRDSFAKAYTNPTDLYHYGLEILIERFCKELGQDFDSGFICAEKRNPTLDRELLEAWEELRTSGIGSGYASSKHIEDRIVGLDLRDKKPNLAGMQLADLVITPVGRHVLKTPEKADQVQWSVVESKLRRVGGIYRGRGLVVRP